jgi:hypothetical protein
MAWGSRNSPPSLASQNPVGRLSFSVRPIVEALSFWETLLQDVICNEDSMFSISILGGVTNSCDTGAGNA